MNFKKAIAAVICAATVLSLASCGKSENSGASSQISNSATGDISYVAMLPSIEDVFPDGEVNVIDSDGGDGYCVQVKGYKDGEYEKYIDGCIAYGFSDVFWNTHGDTTDDFEAYTEDGKYYVSLQLYKAERNVLTISCGKRRSTSS